MEVINDLVGYNNMKIYQNDDWFRFSLESVLLPNFVTINPRYKNILDLCTGNIPIPLILSLRTKANIYGIEIQKDIYDLAVKTVEINNLNNQIKVINDDLINLKKYFSNDFFDLITVNPPYFKNLEDSCKNDDIHKIYARHEVGTNLDDIISISSCLLKNGGRLALVHRTERFFEIIKTLEKYHLCPKKIQFIYPKVDKESNLFMIEAIKNGHDSVKFLNPLFVHNNDGTYTDTIERMFNLKREEL